MDLLERSIGLTRKLTFQQRVNVAAFLYSGKKLLAIGQNHMTKTDTKVVRLAQRFKVNHFVEFPFIHAEVDVIARLWGRYHITGKETLVIVRLDKSNGTRLARPCANCQIILDALGIHKVRWTE